MGWQSSHLCLIDLAPARPSIWAGAFFVGECMNFTLIRAEYDKETQRAYVELRALDDDGGDNRDNHLLLPTNQPTSRSTKPNRI